MRRIRVLNVIGPVARGGTERIMYDILSRLDADKFELEAWSVGTQWNELERQRFEEAGVKTGIIPVDSSRRWRLLAQSYHLIRGQRFDIVHTHHWAANLWVRAAAIMARVPIIMTYEHNYTDESWRRQILWNLLNSRTDRNIMVSNAVREFQRRGHRGCPEKAITITNGIDLERFKPADPGAVLRARERLGLVAQRPVVGTVGRLVDWKRYDLFIKASALIVREMPEVQFLVVGEGPEGENLHSLVNTLGLSENVRLLGWQSQVAEIYNAMDVMVMTSNEREGFGLTSAEAMACGKPVVAVNIPVHAEVVTPECGILVDPEPEGIAQGIRQLLDNPELAHKLGVQGRKRAEKEFDIARTARELASLYEEAVRSKGIPSW